MIYRFYRWIAGQWKSSQHAYNIQQSIEMKYKYKPSALLKLIIKPEPSDSGEWEYKTVHTFMNYRYAVSLYKTVTPLLETHNGVISVMKKMKTEPTNK